MAQTIRVAISGGGLAGASLIQALLKYPSLDVHIFESAKAFKEAGAAVVLARNALDALDLIGASAAQCLERAGAVPLKGVRFMLAQGDGAMIAEADAESQAKRVTSIVHRAAFLWELLAGVPEERMHVSKKLESVSGQGANDGPLILHFTDGSTHECDILIGADGIHSTVRKFILGEDDPAVSPRNTGTWAVMALRPYAVAQASLGEGPVNIEDAREYGWAGDGAYLMHNVLNQGELVQFIIASEDKSMPDSWFRTVSAEKIKQIYQNWPSRLSKAVNELLCDQPEQPAMYLWEHLPARTYVSGPICVVGDAAHATTPRQGSGAGMSIEDSLIISTLLGRSRNREEALVALKTYDEVRRPRTQRIVESSRGTGAIQMGRGEDTGLDLDRLRQKLLPRWDFIIDFDNEKHVAEAIEAMESGLAGLASK